MNIQTLKISSLLFLGMLVGCGAGATARTSGTELEIVPRDSGACG
jgi:hypothetical protein